MVNQSLQRSFRNIYYAKNAWKRPEIYKKFAYGVLDRCQSQCTKADKVEAEVPEEAKDAPQVSLKPKVEKMAQNHSELSKYRSSREDLSDTKWRLELTWLTKALEPALQVCRWALPTGNNISSKFPPSNRSVSEIFGSIQRTKIGIEGWSLSDLTVGLYLIYLRQASLNPFEDVKGVQITSESIVQDLIYHVELAKGSYKNDAFSLARNSMLRESNILKFEKNSSVMRPGYYIGIDPRKKLVIFGIRGTHTVYDLITDIVSSSHEEVTFEGYSTHFGTAEAARWFLTHEIGTIRQCLENHKGFRLRLVGHSLGGAIASLLAIMLRKKSLKELGFSPDIITAVGYATPPCVSRELAESCSDFVTTVVMQDDIIPRLSTTTLARLRNEILQTDWMSVIEKEDWKNVIDLVTNAKQVVSSVQDVARKLADYANFRIKKDSSDVLVEKESSTSPMVLSTSQLKTQTATVIKKEGAVGTVPEELFVPGTVYYLKRNVDIHMSSKDSGGREFFTLWKRHLDEHFQRIVLSSNLISDHKCDSHFYALRDVLKGLPGSRDDHIFPYSQNTN
ncbi:Sn1-specific diacylglycerol lipase alpha [Melia azedarach]|uniref:Sn1-specific diacylglycerol lipase alpha n=1 Tax=Melia azedarach TaxID=155640 RepID=A0ACC1YSQ2_MELAZ|nr:Sn1-specific diacylglycerol lipase alpha [Melia azedarach]